MAALPEYLYIAVLSVIFGFVMAFGIGANDVANAFGSSVSAKSLTLVQAIILGSIMEFLGAILLGASVTGTIRGKIIDGSYYEDQPEVFMLGNLCALIVASVWLLTATAHEFPVSTTHTIVAAIIGFSLAAHGFESIEWFATGMIFLSWVAAPIFSGIISCIFFKTLLEVVLKSEDTFERALKVYPIVVFVGITVNLFFIMFKADNNFEVENYGHVVVLPVSLGGGFLCAVITQFAFCPWLRKRVNRQHDDHVAAVEAARKLEEDAAAAEDEAGTSTKSSEHAIGDTERISDDDEKEVRFSGHPLKDDHGEHVTKKYKGIRGFKDYVADNTYRQDLKKQSLHESPGAASIWEAADLYDEKTERLFAYLQVFTACLASFAHGANDVANAIAPVSGVLAIYKDGEIASKSPVQKWVLAIGGIGIALGFALFGYRIIKAVGFKLTCITPSRGFCIELAAALAVSLASFMQLPVSTTQCLVGATAGMGLASGGRKNVEWWFLLRTMFGWVGIFFASCIVNAGFFAFTAYSPSL